MSARASGVFKERTFADATTDTCKHNWYVCLFYLYLTTDLYRTREKLPGVLIYHAASEQDRIQVVATTSIPIMIYLSGVTCRTYGELKAWNQPSVAISHDDILSGKPVCSGRLLGLKKKNTVKNEKKSIGKGPIFL